MNEKLRRTINTVFERQGLSGNQEKALRDALDPSSSRNPFKQADDKIRNQVIVEMLLHTGIRSGELLGLELCDVNLRESTITLSYAHTYSESASRKKTSSNARARILPMSKKLTHLVRNLILERLRAIKTKSKNPPQLFVDSRKGRPLSSHGLLIIFRTFREAVPELPATFSPLICQYTWNDRFSEYADKMICSGIWTVKDEIEARCQMMGWTENSQMAALYARRHNKEKADEFSLRGRRIF